MNEPLYGCGVVKGPAQPLGSRWTRITRLPAPSRNTLLSLPGEALMNEPFSLLSRVHDALFGAEPAVPLKSSWNSVWTVGVGVGVGVATGVGVAAATGVGVGVAAATGLGVGVGVGVGVATAVCVVSGAAPAVVLCVAAGASGIERAP